MMLIIIDIIINPEPASKKTSSDATQKKQNSSQIDSQTSPDFPDFPDFCSRSGTDGHALDFPRRRSADRASE
jgi:hypothetical protein